MSVFNVVSGGSEVSVLINMEVGVLENVQHCTFGNLSSPTWEIYEILLYIFSVVKVT